MDKIYLSETDRKIAGVCGGLGEYFDKDPILIRILFILVIYIFWFRYSCLYRHVASHTEEAQYG